MARAAAKKAPPAPVPSEPLRLVVPGPVQPWERARRSRRGVWFTPARTRAYEAHVAWHATEAVIRAGWPQAYPGPVQVEVVVHQQDRRPRDLDNLAKGLLDACNGIVWRDDRQVQQLSVRRELDREAPRVEVVVTALVLP